MDPSEPLVVPPPSYISSSYSSGLSEGRAALPLASAAILDPACYRLVEERILAVEAAERRTTSELKRNNEFLKQQLKTTERMCQQRFESLDARSKALEQRMDRMRGNADSTAEEIKHSADELGRQRKWVAETMEALQSRQESFNRDIAMLTEQYFHWERHLEECVNEKLQSFMQETGNSVSSASARSPSLHHPEASGALASAKAYTPIPSSPGSPPNAVGPMALESRRPHKSLMSHCMSAAPVEGALAEQVQDLNDLFSTWAGRQQGCERRIVALEATTGIPSRSFDEKGLCDGMDLRNKTCCTDAFCHSASDGANDDSR